MSVLTGIKTSLSGSWQGLVSFSIAVAWILCLAPSSHGGYFDVAFDAPTTSADGSPLTDLWLYRVYFQAGGTAPCFGPIFQEFVSPTAAPMAGDVVTIRVTGVEAGTNYGVQVTAIDRNRNESDCSDLTSGFAHPDPERTAPIGNITINRGALYTNATEVVLNLAASDDVGVTGYFISVNSIPPSVNGAGWVDMVSTINFSADISYRFGSGDGTKTVYVWFKDAAGNLSRVASDSIVVDQTPPINGSLRAVAGVGQVSLSWAGFSDGGSGLATGDTYRVVVSTGGPPASSCSSGSLLLRGTETNFVHADLTSEVTYYYRVCALDNIGNISPGALASATPFRDSVPPAVYITSPQGASAYETSESSLTLRGTALDRGRVVRVSWSNKRGGGGIAAGSGDWIVHNVPLKPGINVITVTAWDKAGNTGSAQLVVLKKPNPLPPKVTILFPTSKGFLSTERSLLTLWGTTRGASKITKVWWRNERGGNGTASGRVWWKASGIRLYPGANVIHVIAQDEAGNRGVTTLTVYSSLNSDHQPPRVKIVYPWAPSGTYTTKSSSITLGGEARDQIGVTVVAWFNNRGGSAAAAGTTKWTTSAIPLAPGTNDITVTARDATGNTGTAKLRVIRDQG